MRTGVVMRRNENRDWEKVGGGAEEGKGEAACRQLAYTFEHVKESFALMDE